MSEQSTKNKPANTLFKQQRLPAWQPILSPVHVTACFCAIAAIFIPIGIAVMSANDRVGDIEIRYDQINNCKPLNPSTTPAATYIVNTTNASDTYSMGCQTTARFTISEKMTKPVYMYYKLENFYQNHRRYAKSRNDNQLTGSSVSSGDMDDTIPLRNPGETRSTGGTTFDINRINGGTWTTLSGFKYDSFIYSPAGLIPWSKFNDTFRLSRLDGGGSQISPPVCDTAAFHPVTNEPLSSAPAGMPCKKKGIAWDSDVEVKFKKPSFDGAVWTGDRRWYDGDYTGAGIPTTTSDAVRNQYYLNSSDVFYQNGWYSNEYGHAIPHSQDEDLMVWMRTASLPTFRKLYRIIDADLEPGEYEMNINEFFDVSSFNGKKFFALATVSWAGGRNDFLGVAYIVVGACALVAGIAFFVMHKAFGDRSQRAMEELMEQMK